MSELTKRTFKLNTLPCSKQVVCDLCYRILTAELHYSSSTIDLESIRVLHKLCFNGTNYYPNRLLEVEMILKRVVITREDLEEEIQENKLELHTKNLREYNKAGKTLTEISWDITRVIDKYKIDRKNLT